MNEKNKSSLKNISYFDAIKTLRELRYKPRKEWTKKEKINFKVCNFIVLSRKRLNKILDSIKSFGRLGDKSHYKYSEEDLIIIKDLILENLDFSFKKFSKNIEIIRESDLQIIQDRFEKLIIEKQRLSDEIKNFKEELEIHKKSYKEEDITSLKNIFQKVDLNIDKKKSLRKIKSSISSEDMRKASSNWNRGMTIEEIKNEVLKKNLNLVNTKKKKFKL